jgi:hypothetical protein
MGTPLTGSTVASTYTGLLKTTDNATLTSSLKALSDGSGNDSALQVSTVASNINGDFSVATNKFTVASASGNTAVAGTLAVTGATSLSSLITSGNATIGGTLGITGGLTIPGTLSVTGISTLTGAVGMGSTLNVTGLSTLASLGVTGAATIGTTLGVTGLSTLGSLTVTGATNFNTTNTSGLSTLAELDNLGDAAIGGTLVVTGATTLGSNLAVSGNSTLSGNLSANGNTTLGNAGTDTLTLNSDNITVPNISTVTVSLANDKVFITDASDSSKVKVVAASELGITASNAPQSAQTLYQGSTAGGSPYVASSSGSGVEVTDLTTSITPRSATSKVLVTIAINYTGTNVQYGAFRITRNGTEIGSNTVGSSLFGIAPLAGINPYSSNFLSSQFIQILDSPGTASAVTYKIHIYTTGAGGIFPQVWINKTYNDVSSGNNSSTDARTSSSMILQEYFA